MTSEKTPGAAETGGLETRDLELIAAFIDRRLSDEERREFVERLDREDALYDVFVETVRFRDQDSAAATTVVEHPASRNRWAVPAAIAAALALAVVAPRLYRGLAGAGYAETLVADDGLGAALGEGWYEQGWSEMRGLRPGTGEAETAFRIGVQVVDLETALRLERDEDARTLAGRLEYRLEAVDLSEPLKALYRRLGELVDGAGGRAEALEMARSAESILPDYLADAADAYELGQWTEAGRLAARSGNVALLRSRSFRRKLRDLRREQWDPAVELRLASLAESLHAPASRIDLAALEESFTVIIDES